MQSGLRALGSRTGLQLGTTWTVLVVVQIAFSLAALPAAIEMGWGTLRPGIVGPGFAAEQYLSARLVADRELLAGTAAEGDQPLFSSRFGALQTELVRQLIASSFVSDKNVLC